MMRFFVYVCVLNLYLRYKHGMGVTWEPRQRNQFLACGKRAWSAHNPSKA